MSEDGTLTDLITLYTDCAGLAFRISRIDGNDKIDWIRFKVPDSGFDTSYPIADSPNISIPNGHFYPCEKGIYPASWPKMETPVTLHIGDLKMELDRDPESANSGVFSKKEHTCSTRINLLVS